MTAYAFEAGAPVRVRDDWPEARGPAHIRTPHFVRGASGTVVSRLGAFPNPEDLAFARPAATVPLYHVAFASLDLWPDPTQTGDVLVEIYEHWLEPAP